MLSSLHVAKCIVETNFRPKILKDFLFEKVIRKSSQTESSKIDFHRGQESEEFEESVREPWHDIAAATTGLIMTCWTSKRDRLENSAVSSGEETRRDGTGRDERWNDTAKRDKEREKPDKKGGKKKKRKKKNIELVVCAGAYWAARPLNSSHPRLFPVPAQEEETRVAWPSLFIFRSLTRSSFSTGSRGHMGLSFLSGSKKTNCSLKQREILLDCLQLFLK